MLWGSLPSSKAPVALDTLELFEALVDCLRACVVKSNLLLILCIVNLACSAIDFSANNLNGSIPADLFSALPLMT